MPFLRQIKRRQRRFRSPRFFRFFKQNTEAEFFRKNSVELFRDSADLFPALFAALQSASVSIDLEFYIVHADKTGQMFADLLLEAAGRGITVNLLYDYIGCLDTPSAYFRRLEQGGVHVTAFNPPTFKRGLHWLDKRDHRKLALIDRKTAFLGGMNIADEYSATGTNHWRDVGIRVEGPAVIELQWLFWENWLAEGGQAPAWHELALQSSETGTDDVLIVNGGPHHARSFIRNAYRMAIAGASTDITILTPYFIPGPRVIRALLRAAARGVRVQIVLPALSDVPLARLISRSFYSALLKGGIEIYEWEESVLHAKVMLVDDCWVTIGSANLDHRSFHRNYEVNVIIDSTSFGSQVEEMITEDITHARRVTIAEHEARHWLERLFQFILSPISRFL